MPRTRVFLCVIAVVAAAPAAAFAQEGAAGLGAPSPSGGTAPAAETPPTPEAPPAGYEVPPPPGSEVPPPPEARPPSSYGEPEGRYPSATGALAHEAEGVRIPSRIATRLRVLDADFSALSSRGGNALVDGILSILTGGLSITLGIVIDHEFLSPYLYVYGAAGVARGVIDLVLMPNPSEAAITFSHMPMNTMEQVHERLAYGERALEDLADETRLARILDAAINIGVGVAIVPLYIGPNGFDEIDTFGIFVIIGAGISVISGVINLLSRSEAERRWSAYEDLSERLEREEQQASIDWHLGAAPLPGGGALTLSATF